MAIDNTAYDVGNGKILYDNAPTVCGVALVDSKLRVLMVKRKNNPQEGKWALPAGFQMKGETLQEAACRELFEETNVKLHPDDLVRLTEPVTDEYKNNMIIFRLNTSIPARLLDATIKAGDDAVEAQWLGVGDIEGWRDPFREYPDVMPLPMAFPRHTKAALEAIRHFYTK